MRKPINALRARRYCVKGHLQGTLFALALGVLTPVAFSSSALAAEGGALQPKSAPTSSQVTVPGSLTSTPAPLPDALLGKKASVAATLPGVATPSQLDPQTNGRLVDISRQLRCLVCQNQSIADASADIAVEMRNEVARQIEAGKTDDEIIASMVEQYGDFVLYKPAFKSSTWLLWLSPLIFFLFALWAVLGRGRRGAKEAVDDTSSREALEALQARALAMLRGDEPFDAERLRVKKQDAEMGSSTTEGEEKGGQAK